ncbi:MAG: long-chain fatty acid--CoA ligase [Alphaproteobacteria bacterium]|nr:MAG: long-chain fatty acid--CoA ligase [Alphaproteobacteria bacterium]
MNDEKTTAKNDPSIQNVADASAMVPTIDFDPERLLAPSMAALIGEACREHGPKPAYSCILPNGWHASLGFAEIDALSDAIAFFLREELGLEQGEVVAVMAPNCLGYPIAAYGAMKAGLVLTGINPLYTPREAAHQLADARAGTLFVIDLFADRLEKSLSGTDVRHLIRLSVTDFFPWWKRRLVEARLRREGRLAPLPRPAISLARAIELGRRRGRGRDSAVLRRGRRLDDVAIFQYTGGTTGRSKGAEITEYNLLANITQQDLFTGETLRAQAGAMETSLLVLPLYHVYALAIGAMHAMRAGTHLVLVPNPRPLSNLKPAFETFEITVLPGVSSLFQGLLAEDWFVRSPPASLKLCFSGAAPLSESVRRRWREVTGCEIHEGYGLTEGTCIVTSSPLDERTKPGTVGMPLPGTRIRIVDEAGRDLPTGQAGEILVQGPQVMRAYRNRPEETRTALKDGWLHTGDIGYLDEDGFLTIVDRKKDMIIVSGFNVYPAEIEAVLAEHPGVREVAVVGAPDERSGEAPWAFIVANDPTPTEEELRAHVAERLTNYKRVRRIVFMDELPKSPVGKILRRTLRERARELAIGGKSEQGG